MHTTTKNNLFVSLCCASLAFQTYLLYGMQVNFYMIYAVFFSTLFIYSFHRFEKIRSGVAKKKQNTTSTEQKTLKKWSLFSLLLLSPLVLILPIPLILILLALGLLTIWYSLGLLKTKKGRNPLRKVPYLKLFWIGGIWTVMTVVVPLIGEELTLDYALLFAERLLFVLAITIPFDIRDMESDMEEGLKTIPNALGLHGSKLLSIGLLLLFIVLNICGVVIGFHSRIQLFMLVLSALISVGFIKNIHKDSPDSYFSIGIEGLSLVQSALIVLSFLLEY